MFWTSRSAFERSSYLFAMFLCEPFPSSFVTRYLPINFRRLGHGRSFLSKMRKGNLFLSLFRMLNAFHRSRETYVRFADFLPDLSGHMSIIQSTGKGIVSLIFVCRIEEGYPLPFFFIKAFL